MYKVQWHKVRLLSISPNGANNYDRATCPPSNERNKYLVIYRFCNRPTINVVGYFPDCGANGSWQTGNVITHWAYLPEFPELP